MGKNTFLKSVLGLLILAALVGFFFKLFEEPKWQEIKNSPNQEKINTELSSANAESSKNGLFSFLKENLTPVNFLLLGASGSGYEAPDLTDTILVARFDQAKNKIFLFSLPRDLLVKIPDSNNFTKLNALYAYSKNEKNREFENLRKKAEEITGLKIQHHILVDLDFVKKLVDFFGGVNIWVEKDILDTAFPGPNHSYQTFELKSGWRYLDGETAEKFVRTRHSSSGDFDRITRQQEILQALKQKTANLKFWEFNKFLEIYQILAQNVKTDLNFLKIKNWWEKTKDIPGANIVKTDIMSENLFESGSAALGNAKASIVKPKAGLENYEEIKKFVEEAIK